MRADRPALNKLSSEQTVQAVMGAFNMKMKAGIAVEDGPQTDHWKLSPFCRIGVVRAEATGPYARGDAHVQKH